MTKEARPTGPGEATDARGVLATLRPQAYGNSKLDKIRNPLIEPLWIGVRTLAAVDARGAVLVDSDGDPVPGMSPIVDALGASLQADGVVLDGFLSKQTAHASAVIVWKKTSGSRQTPNPWARCSMKHTFHCMYLRAIRSPSSLP